MLLGLLEHSTSMSDTLIFAGESGTATVERQWLLCIHWQRGHLCSGGQQ